MKELLKNFFIVNLNDYEKISEIEKREKWEILDLENEMDSKKRGRKPKEFFKIKFYTNKNKKRILVIYSQKENLDCWFLLTYLPTYFKHIYSVNIKKKDIISILRPTIYDFNGFVDDEFLKLDLDELKNIFSELLRKAIEYYLGMMGISLGGTSFIKYQLEPKYANENFIGKILTEIEKKEKRARNVYVKLDYKYIREMLSFLKDDYENIDFEEFYNIETENYFLQSKYQLFNFDYINSLAQNLDLNEHERNVFNNSLNNLKEISEYVLKNLRSILFKKVYIQEINLENKEIFNNNPFSIFNILVNYIKQNQFSLSYFSQSVLQFLEKKLEF